MLYLDRVLNKSSVSRLAHQPVSGFTVALQQFMSLMLIKH